MDNQLPLDPARLWPDYQPTDLIELPKLARRANVERVFAKLENQRPLGNFKSLGGYLAGIRALARHKRASEHDRYRDRLPALLCASEGNHGLAVAAAAASAGAKAYVYLPDEVSGARSARIGALGAEVIRVAGTYDDAVELARQAEEAGVGLLIPDTSADPDHPVVADVMEGYATIARELATQLPGPGGRPTHAFVQAGVGGLAAAMARGLAGYWDGQGQLITVEPVGAPSVMAALGYGQPLPISGDLQTAATMLACGIASAPAIKVLLERGAQGIVVHEQDLASAVVVLEDVGGPASTPSGAAGVAGLLRIAADQALRASHRLDEGSRVLLLITEGTVEAALEGGGP